MPVLVILNMEDTSLGIVGEVLAEAGHAIDARAAHAGDVLPGDHDGHRALLVLGGAQNALDDEGSPWLPQVMDLMRGFAGAGKPVLGICLGAQLLARAFGGENHVGTAPEFAWTGIAPTLDGEADPLDHIAAPALGNVADALDPSHAAAVYGTRASIIRDP